MPVPVLHLDFNDPNDGKILDISGNDNHVIDNSPDGYMTFDGVKGSEMSITNGGRTVTRGLGTGWQSAWSTFTIPESGLWAIEIINEVSIAGNQYPIIGMDDIIDTSIYPDRLACAQISNTYRILDGTFTGGFFSTVLPGYGLAGHRSLVVFDLDTRNLYALRDDSGSMLLSPSGVSVNTNTLYFGLGSYEANSFTLNSGQEAFSDYNEVHLTTLEATLGKSINRGIYVNGTSPLHVTEGQVIGTGAYEFAGTKAIQGTLPTPLVEGSADFFFTIEGTGAQTLFEAEGISVKYDDTNTRINFNINGNIISTPSATWADGAKHKASLTWDEAEYSAYIDGELIDTFVGSTIGWNLSGVETTYTLGNSSALDNGLTGVIDDPRIFDVALTAPEVKSLSQTRASLINIEYNPTLYLSGCFYEEEIPDLREEAVMRLEFDEGSGVYTYDSAIGKDRSFGPITGGASLTTFDGENVLQVTQTNIQALYATGANADDILCPDLGKAFSIEIMWYHDDFINMYNHMAIFRSGQGSGFLFIPTNSGTYSGYTVGRAGALRAMRFGATPTAGWWHVVVTTSGADLLLNAGKAYINNIEQTVNTTGGFASYQDKTGILLTNVNQYLSNHKKNFVRVYDKELSAEEVSLLYGLTGIGDA